MQIVVNYETRLCSPFLGPGDNFLQSYGAIFTDRAATGSGSLTTRMSTLFLEGIAIPQSTKRHVVIPNTPTAVDQK